MASFRIHNDLENNSNVLRPKNKDFANNQGRSVLGVVNNNAQNAKNSKNAGQGEKGGLKPKLGNKTTSLGDRGKIIQNINGVLPKPKAPLQPFDVFEDEAPPAKPAAQLKHESKHRVLRERKNEVLPSVGIHLPRHLAPPEPMSPATPSESELSDSPMCLDVSLKSDRKLAAECEAAMRDLDYLNLTERLYMCEEYRDEISLYLKALQHDHRPRKNYMARQPDITYNMRAVLVDWLVEVVEEYRMTNETLYLAVSYIDRFLSSMSVIRSKLQLVGTAAMFIAAKYEEIYPPDVKDFVYITDDTYTKRQVLRMEHLVLRILHFDLSVPTALNFLKDYTAHHPTPEDVTNLAMYLCELSLLQGDPYLGFLPSEVAAGALCVARACLMPEEDVMPPSLRKILDVHLPDIMHIIAALESTHRNAESSTQQATRDKFKTDKYRRVALIPPSETECSSLLSREFTPTPERPQPTHRGDAQ